MVYTRTLHGRDLKPPTPRLKRVSDIVGAHRRAQLPGDDVTRVVIEDGGEVVPAPADDLEIGEIGLPELVGRSCLVPKLVSGLDDDEGWAGDQVQLRPSIADETDDPET